MITPQNKEFILRGFVPAFIPRINTENAPRCLDPSARDLEPAVVRPKPACHVCHWFHGRFPWGLQSQEHMRAWLAWFALHLLFFVRHCLSLSRELRSTTNKVRHYPMVYIRLQQRKSDCDITFMRPSCTVSSLGDTARAPIAVRTLES